MPNSNESFFQRTGIDLNDLHELSEAAKVLKVQSSHASQVANGKLKQHKGWKFEKITKDNNNGQ